MWQQPVLLRPAHGEYEVTSNTIFHSTDDDKNRDRLRIPVSYTFSLDNLVKQIDGRTDGRTDGQRERQTVYTIKHILVVLLGLIYNTCTGYYTLPHLTSISCHATAYCRKHVQWSIRPKPKKIHVYIFQCLCRHRISDSDVYRACECQTKRKE